MARLIEFRSWNKYHKKMHSVYEINFDHSIAKTRDDETGGTYTFGFIDLELMQFTGEKDFFGTKIFEGDIVFIDSRMTIGEVVMDVFAWKIKTGDEYLWLCDFYDTSQVIGNIHQNHELLEKKQ